MESAQLEPIIQIGYVVSDLDEAVSAWNMQSGIGPWKIYRSIEMEGTCRGVAVTVVIDVAMGYSGDTQLELIEAKSPAPSPYHQEDGSPILGIHHVARLTEDLDAEIARADERGQQLVFTGGAGSSQVAYFESQAMPGVVIEYISNPQMSAMLEAGIEEARNWDGVDLIR